MTIFISGGAASGKSDLAQDLAVALAGGGVHYYVATMLPCDEEDYRRIDKHLASREGMGFETIECGRDILTSLDQADQRGTFLLDSVTALLMNEMFPDPVGCEMDLQAPARCAAALVTFAQSVGNGVFVSDHIYCDADRYDVITEAYRQGLAHIDRALAMACDTVLELTAGNVIIHKGELPI